MKNLSVSYLGLKLKNPVIVASSGLTASLSKIREMEDAGAGAVVIKSLFEEQINIETASISYYSDYPEAADYVAEYTRHNSIEKHLDLIRSAKSVCSIPIIASIACVTGGEWVSFARKIEEAGADALELNIYILPTCSEESSDAIESRYLDSVAAVCNSVSIPVSVKIGQNFTNIPSIARKLYYRGAKGVVMFNRFYEPDIDVDTMSVVSSGVLSNPSELRNVLRWVAISSASVGEIDYAATTGIHDGEAVVKALLCGASAVEVCSSLYRNGSGVIGSMLEYLEKWLAGHRFSSVSDMKGRCNYANISNPAAFERTQFMKYFHGYGE